MTVSNHSDSKNNTLTIQVSGRFDFYVTQAFRDTYRNSTLPGGNYIVDLSRTDYMDSAALGMLLLLREHAMQHEAKVHIKGTSESLRRILSIARFEQLFDIR